MVEGNARTGPDPSSSWTSWIEAAAHREVRRLQRNVLRWGAGWSRLHPLRRDLHLGSIVGESAAQGYPAAACSLNSEATDLGMDHPDTLEKMKKGAGNYR